MSQLKRPYEFGRASFYPFFDIAYCAKLAGWFFLLGLVPSTVLMFSPQLGLPLFEGFGWLIALALGLLYWALYASYITAFHKRAMKNEDGGIFPLRFGRTEFQVMFVQFVWFLAALMIYIIVSLGFGIINLIGAGIASAGGAFGIFGGALIVLSLIATFLTLAYALGRICPVTAMTVYMGQFTFSDSTTATENKGWWIVLSFLVISIIYIVVYGLSVFMIMPLFGGSPFIPYASNGLVGILIGIISTFPFIIVMQMFSGVGAYLTKIFYGQSNVEKIAALYD